MVPGLGNGRGNALYYIVGDYTWGTASIPSAIPYLKPAREAGRAQTVGIMVRITRIGGKAGLCGAFSWDSEGQASNFKGGGFWTRGLLKGYFVAVWLLQPLQAYACKDAVAHGSQIPWLA